MDSLTQSWALRCALLAMGLWACREPVAQLPGGDEASPADSDGFEGADDGGPPGGEGDAVGDDADGSGGDPVVVPEICVSGSFTAYFGNLHAHSKNSDGQGTPAEAFTYARDVGGLDVFILTDHLEQLFLPGDPIWVPRWTACTDAASGATTAAFVGLCGYEYGAGIDPLALDTTGHANVFFPSELFSDLMLDFHQFYAKLGACSTCWGQFNHPGASATQTWSDWEYDAAAAARMALFEMNGGGPTWDLIFAALDAGWWLSPSNDQDNHSADWGTKNDHRTGLWLAGLSASEVERAMAGRRTFSTEDLNASLALATGDGCFIGSLLHRAGATVLEVEAVDADPSDGFAALEIYGPGQTLLAAHDCAGAASCTAALSVDLSGVAYVIARAVQSDGDVLVSGPLRNRP